MLPHLVLRIILAVTQSHAEDNHSYLVPLDYYVHHSQIENIGVTPMHQVIPLHRVDRLATGDYYDAPVYYSHTTSIDNPENGEKIEVNATVLIGIQHIAAVEVVGHAYVFNSHGDFWADFNKRIEAKKRGEGVAG